MAERGEDRGVCPCSPIRMMTALATKSVERTVIAALATLAVLLAGCQSQVPPEPGAEWSPVAKCLGIAVPREAADVLGNVYRTERTSIGYGPMEVMYSVKGDCVTYVEKTIYGVNPARAFVAGRVGALQRQFGATHEDMAVLATALAEMHELLVSAEPRADVTHSHHASAGRVVNGICRMWTLGMMLSTNLSVTFALVLKSDIERCGG